MRYFCLWGGGGGKRGSKLTHPLKGFRSWHITTYVARRSDSDGERVLKWFPARGFWLTTRFLEQFGINKHLFQRLQIAPALRVVFEKNYSCELKSNCTRNHVITYTNRERQDEQAALCKDQQVMNIASMWLAAWRTMVIWFVNSASPRYRECAFMIFSPFRFIIRAKPWIILTQLTQKFELHFGFSKFRHGRLIPSLNGMILKREWGSGTG